MRDEEFITIAKAIADPTRRKMIDELRRARTGLTCSCMLERFNLSQPTISHHVRTLERAGLVTITKQGQFHQLALNRRVIERFAAALLRAPRHAKPR